MKASAVKYGVLTWVSRLTILIILLMPFHAFLTVWAAHIFGHYTAFRLWKEVILVFLGIAAVFLLATDHKIRTHTLSRRLVWLIGAYVLVNIVWGLLAWHAQAVTGKALGYGLIVNLRFLIFFLVSWAVSLRLARMHSHWQWIVLWPSFIVIVFGLLQVFVLPKEFLAHFGYGPDTIPPYETINHNSHYLRIASTLRGANPLGAYLIVPISFLTVLLLRRRIEKRQIALLACAVICLFFSFSRSAWIGALISFVIAVLFCVHSVRAKRWALYGAVGFIVVAAGLFVGLRHSGHFQNFVFHTEDRSTVKVSSNDDHASALKRGVEDVVHEPQGRGTGTAGPASVYNTGHPVRIAEDYYLQIGQETGLLGLAMFVLINVGVGALLWVRRNDSLALALFASLVGISFVNLLAHAWTDDTLAYIWWGLAGIAMAPHPRGEQAEESKDASQSDRA